MSKRRWRPKQENPIDPPPGGYENYLSFQKQINVNNGEIDPDILQDHVEFILNNNWEEIPVSFELLIKGDQIRYTTLTPEGKHLFRTGGFVTAIDEENDEPEWMAYMAHTKSTWCLQLEDCQRLFVFRKIVKSKEERKAARKAKAKTRKETKSKKVTKVRFKRPVDETNFNVYLFDSDGEEQLVYAARDNHSKRRFENSAKFTRANEIGWEFKVEDDE